MSGKIKEINAEQFDAEVLASDIAVVDFYSTECPPCEALAAKFEPLSEIYGDAIHFVKIFRQGNRDLAKSMDVTGSPTLLFFHNGKKTGDTLTGAIRRSDIMKNLDALLPEDTVRNAHARIIPKDTDADVIIIGAGPAGLTAGIYLAQAHQRVIAVDTALPGGYVSTTHQISNYPGFIKAINGYELSHNIAEQAKANGVQFRAAAEIDEIDLENHTLRVDGWETLHARKIIIATGSKPKPLGIAGEKEYIGQGISYCATCDAKYYEGKDVVIIGGGNSAVEESEYISKFASSITLVHRSSHLRANKEAQDKAFSNAKIKFMMEHQVKEIKKYAPFDMGVVVQDIKTGNIREVRTHGVFIFIGFEPNVGMFGGKLKLDPWGYIVTDPEMRTNIPGVFSAGDVNAKPFRQITTAVSDGTIAAIAAIKELQ